jgi:ABC-2 type transport system ATP-binding protein
VIVAEGPPAELSAARTTAYRVIVAEGPPAELSAARTTAYRVSWIEDGRRVEEETDDPTELLHRLTGEALDRGERLEGLSVTRPSLEDVYLDLTAETESAAVTTEAAPAAQRT